MRQLSSLAAIAIGLNFANADATTDYIQTLPWPVDIVAPKMHIVSPDPNLVAPYCNLNLIQALAHAIYIDEIPTSAPTNTPITTGSMADITTSPLSYTSIELGKTKRSSDVEVEASSQTHENDKARQKIIQSPFEAFLKPMAFFSDVYDYIDGVNNRVPRGATSALPLYSDANASPEAKMRLLLTTIALHSRKSPILQSHIDTHDSLSGMPHEQKLFVKALMEGKLEAADFDNQESLSDSSDDTLMDSIPETMVGFLSSRVLTEMIAEMIGDAWGQSIIHDSNENSLAAGVCRGLALGKVTDYLPEVTACTLMTILLNFLGCTYSNVPIACDDTPPIKYELANCELLPADMTTASVIDLKLLDHVDDAVDAKEFKFTDAGRQTEGPTFYALQIAQNEWSQACAQRWCQKPATDATFIKTLIPGWNIVREVWLAQENSNAEVDTPTKISPFTALAQKETTDGTCEFLVLNRGTATNWEWFMNLSLWQAILPQLQDPKARGHFAYYVIANNVVQVLNEHLMNVFQDGTCTPELTTVWFHGHSLGGGQTNMQSMLLAAYWKNNDQPLTVNAVGMASLRVFNEAAAEKQKALVNTRNMQFNYDMVPGMGCVATGIRRCNPQYWSASPNGEGEDQPYAESNGLIKILGGRDFMHAPVRNGEATNIAQTLNFFNDRRFAYLPLTPYLLAAKDSIFINIPTLLQTGTAHGCSYQCYVSRNFCSVVPSKQMACVRRPINVDNPSNCFNSTPEIEDVFGEANDRAASLDCTPEYWGWDKLPNYDPEKPSAYYNSTLPYFCHSCIAGIGPETLQSMVGTGSL